MDLVIQKNSKHISYGYKMFKLVDVIVFKLNNNYATTM